MPGNSQRRGAIKKSGKGNPTAGSRGRRRQGLEGKGPTPRAEEPEFGVALQWHRTSRAAAVSYGLASFADGTQPDVEGGTACPE